MSQINAGFTYVDNSTSTGGTQTDVNSHELIDNATIRDILTSEMADNTTVIRSGVGYAHDDPKALPFRFGDSLLLISRERGIDDRRQFEAVAGSLRAQASHSITNGALCEADGTTYFVNESHVSSNIPTPEARYVANSNTASGAWGLFNSKGVVSVLVTGDVVPGSVLVNSDVTGWAQPIENAAASDSIDTGSIFGMVLHTNMGSGLVTCMMWG